MFNRYMKIPLAIAVGVSLCFTLGCEDRAGGGAPSPSQAPTPTVIASEPLAEHRLELLNIAFDVASAIPKEPHIKDRSRSQEEAISAALELGQVQYAINSVELIDNWRRGVCYAEIASHLAKHQVSDPVVDQYLMQAEKIAEQAGEWRRDRVLASIGQARIWLGQDERSDELQMQLAEDEAGKIVAARSLRIEEEQLESHLESLDMLAASGGFDAARHTLAGLVRLYGRFYSNASVRPRIEERIRETWIAVPVAIRLELLLQMADAALTEDDPGEAMRIVNEATIMLDSSGWRSEHDIPVRARLASLRGRAGEVDAAAEELRFATARFETDYEMILNIDRAGVLRTIAEAWHSLGEIEASLAEYRRALDEGLVNPNARPRAQDLSATCLSMAMIGVQPDDAMWVRIRTIREKLGHPW